MSLKCEPASEPLHIEARVPRSTAPLTTGRLHAIETLQARPEIVRQISIKRVYKVVSQKSTPAQIRQLVLYISNNEEKNDRFGRELSFSKRLNQHYP